MSLNKLYNFDITHLIFLLYIVPLIIWPISLHPTFSLIEKSLSIVILASVFFGLKFLYTDYTIPVIKKPFKKVKKVMPDLNTSIFSLLSPQVTITLVCAACIGGSLTFQYLYNDLYSFLFGSCAIFIIILGLEFLFQDLYMKPKKITKHNIVSHAFNKLHISSLFAHYKLCLISGFGGLCFYLYYSSTLSGIATGVLTTGFVYIGLTLLTSPTK